MRRTALIMWCAFVAGALVLTVVAATVGPRVWSRVGDAVQVAGWVVFAMALPCVLAAIMLSSRMKPPPGALPDGIALGRSVVASAMSGSMALLAPLAWMISGKMIALVALAISLVGLLLAFPSERRWQKLSRVSTASGGHDLVGGGEVPWLTSRYVMAYVLGVSVPATALMVVMGYGFWTTVVLGSPASPITGALFFSLLALTMIGLAVLRS